MTLARIAARLNDLPALKNALDRIESGTSAAIADFPDPATAALAAASIRAFDAPTLIVTTRTERADNLATALSEYLDDDYAVGQWTPPDALPYEQLPVDLDAGVARVRTLQEMLAPGSERHVWITPVSGLMQLVTPPDQLAEMTLMVRVGKRQPVDALHQWATRVGYVTAAVVQEPGTIARRGGIVDVFPPGEEYPIRLDFFGDEVESIRRFDPHTQRSLERVNRVHLSPPSELPVWLLPEISGKIAKLDRSTLRPEVDADWQRRLDHMSVGTVGDSIELFAGYLVPSRSTLLDYLPKGTRIIIDQPGSVVLSAKQIDKQARDLARTFVDSGELPKGMTRPFVSAANVQDALAGSVCLSLGSTETDDIEVLSAAELGDPPVHAGHLTNVSTSLRSALDEGWSIAIGTDQVDRLTDVVEQNEVYPTRIKAGAKPRGAVEPGSLTLEASNLLAGWQWPAAKVGVWTDFEIFGFRKQSRKSGKRTVSESRTFAQGLTPGEFVVHIDHGIAKFNGLVRLETGGIEREYLFLEYERGDKLYVPVDQSDRVSRYSGGGVNPALNRLGGGDWATTRRKVRRAVREMAFELIQLYAYREAGKGYAFPPSSRWDQELEDSFPYTETLDQDKAIRSVEKDMETDRPMDRLVCGDVGFGKTEVAIRAAFKAVNAGKQVAILVPTTVLALQHFTTFRERLAAFPVRVEMLSRLRSRKEQEAVLDGLRTGTVDIVIGTHRLVQKDVTFKDLGLVVVDEEQRFGVRHKEFLKQLRSEVDVLTMSATPIPRTLHMSLSGIRDISMIETAPQARLPIRTFVTAFEDHLLREVILRELDRGGQVFVVHNRVHDIDHLASRLRSIVPEARFGIGHGQMDEHVLEEVMLGFVRRDFDVLIATTIIESGVDIPNVNTIIIDNADTLGLTQLYQLRGRVGRSNHRAYAYLLHQPHKSLSEEAMERLETIQEATELGAGLRVAMRDLEIRGAGNMLGAEQSGHIASVGYELYVRLLSQAIEEARTGRPIEEMGPVTLDLPMTALLPMDYVSDTELRLNLYRQIAALTSLEEMQELEDELRDRFGDYPEEVEHLFALIALRIRSSGLGIDSVVERDREILIRPVDTSQLDKAGLQRHLAGAVRISPNAIRIRLLDLEMPWQDALSSVLDAVEASRTRGLAHVA